jgi:hypothetical protein
MNEPTFTLFCGPNAMKMEWDDLTLYYSYQTIVGFIYKGKRYVSVNAWGTTTGKHINAIDQGRKKERLSEMDFNRALDAALNLFRGRAPRPTCGHSICSQNFIDTGNTNCVLLDRPD